MNKEKKTGGGQKSNFLIQTGQLHSIIKQNKKIQTLLLKKQNLQLFTRVRKGKRNYHI